MTAPGNSPRLIAAFTASSIFPNCWTSMVPREAAGSLARASIGSKPIASSVEKNTKKGKHRQQTACGSLVDKFLKPLTFGMCFNQGLLRSLPFPRPHGCPPTAERRGCLFQILRGLRRVSEVGSAPGLPGGRRPRNQGSVPTARENTEPLARRHLY